MELFNTMDMEDFEQIIFSHDKESGLKAITAIHDTSLGPALGGIRYYPYDSETAAFNDALRLAKGMTYKNAAAGLPLGGGKTVFIKDPDKEVNEEALFRAFGRYVESMNGRYIPSVDVGTTTAHLDYLYLETDYVVGSNNRPGASGNPSPSTAHGIFLGIKAAVHKVFGTNSLEGRTILLEGFGKVGSLVAEKALADGATVIATDISPESRERAQALGCQVVDPETLFEHAADIYTPCALGGTINDQTVPEMKAAGIKIVAGAANNQLAETRHGELLKENDILYVPDYIINSGGVIHVSDELSRGFDQERTENKVSKIYDQIQKVFELAETHDLPINIAADRFAEERIEAIRKTKRIYT